MFKNHKLFLLNKKICDATTWISELMQHSGAIKLSITELESLGFSNHVTN